MSADGSDGPSTEVRSFKVPATVARAMIESSAGYTALPTDDSLILLFGTGYALNITADPLQRRIVYTLVSPTTVPDEGPGDVR